MTAHRRQPCAACPWRLDQPRRFKPGRFRALAGTAHDMSSRLFTCHKSPEDKPALCAGFLLRGANHNMAVRLMLIRSTLDLSAVSDGGHALHENYRAMAMANGVRAENAALRGCR